MRKLAVRDLGLIPFREAWDLQRTLEDQRKRGEGEDHLLLLEHPHVLTLGRNAQPGNLLVSRERLATLGIGLVEIDRGGDITYHGPGQIIGYPIIDLRLWKRDVVAYIRALEEVILRALHRFGITGARDASATGVWVEGAKICAMGVHISRWVTTHGFALNWTTDLSFFDYIVPCGLRRPVTSMERLGVHATRGEVLAALAAAFAEVFDYETAGTAEPPLTPHPALG
jgi:lipoyl(octanoyl) transferase